MHTATPRSATTHYQTSFRVKDPDGHVRRRLMEAVFKWVAGKEIDPRIETGLDEFSFQSHWPHMHRTKSSVHTETFLAKEGNAWAMHYVEVDGRRRAWYSDIGLKQEGAMVIASVRISFAWNDEDLRSDREDPTTTVPRVVRLMMEANHVFSGRPEFRLLQKPIQFKKVGMGKALADFIQSPERRYPLVVFNGDFPEHLEEAAALARELTGKCQVAIVANNEELAEEIRLFLPTDYRVPWGFLRVFFPFGQQRNSPVRHRWYDARVAEYGAQRQGLISGLLRNHSLFESGAVETIEDIRRLENRAKLIRLEAASPEHKRQLDEFLEEHARVAAERDQFKQEAAAYATEVDERGREVSELRAECATYRDRLRKLGGSASVAEVLPTLPESLAEVAVAASRCFPHLIITDRAVDAAKDYSECKSVGETWEMLRHLEVCMYRLRFVDEGQKDLERTFRDETGYDLAMSEGAKTKQDKKLMRLRKIEHGGREYDITPHVKHLNNEPKAVRIYFAFDEDAKKIVVGHIGRHIPNATSKTM